MQQLFQWITAPFRLLFHVPLAMISAPRRVMGLSLPARVAWITAVLLLICAVAAFVSTLLTEDGADSWNYWLRWETPVVFLLLVAIPLVVYFAVRSWLEGEVSRYPDIDQAWRAGLAALQEQGLELSELPVFLVLGAGDERQVRSLLAASGLEFLVQHTPSGVTPLHWYATTNGIFLVCREVGQLSWVTSMTARGRAPQAPPANAAGQGTAPGSGTFTGTMSPGAASRGTISSGGASNSLLGIPDGEAGDDQAAGSPVYGTLVPGAVSAGPGPRGGGAAAASGGGLSRREAEEQTDRLRYLARLLVRARQPLCPLNGVLTVLPFPIVRDVMLAKDLPGAIKSDLDALGRVMQLRCSVTVLVSGMEAEPGFSELVRRVGATRAKANRFGKGFNVWNAATEEHLDAFSAHACGAFEDWVYNLFREPDGLSKPGNARLYMLLCRIRSEVRRGFGISCCTGTVGIRTRRRRARFPNSSAAVTSPPPGTARIARRLRKTCSRRWRSWRRSSSGPTRPWPRTIVTTPWRGA